MPSNAYLLNNCSTSWYLPACSSFEHRGFYLNILGYIQLTRKCTSKLGLSMSHSDILLNLFMRLFRVHTFYKNTLTVSSSTFYSYFLDNIIIYASDIALVRIGTSFTLQMSHSFNSVTYSTIPSAFPYYINYSPTLNSVSTLRVNSII